MKKKVYIILFILLGLLLQFLIHAVAEIQYIDLLLKDFDKFSLGFSWENWTLFHHITSIILLIAGFAFGFWQGFVWWRKIYENKKVEDN